MECIILAGGLGTRLRGVIGNMPKCMAPVAGKPFLEHLLLYLSGQGTQRVVLSLGFAHAAVIDWLATRSYPFAVDHVIEEQPLGTGGGIRLAMAQCRQDEVFVLNGDTMFTVDLRAMREAHAIHGAETSLALKSMKDFDRYGTVRTDSTGTITSFEEKTARAEGDINGGIYLIRRQQFLARPFPEKWSFEQDYLERYVTERKFFGYRSEGYFIDIGVPHDYEQAQQDFAEMFP